MKIKGRGAKSIIDLQKARELQEKLGSKVIIKWDSRKINLVAGGDFGYDRNSNRIGAIIVVQKYPGFETIEISKAIRDVELPYIPGFLSFREGPVFFDAFRKIRNKPDITLIDGNGIAHPRRMGLASYVGVVLDIATIGCAKNAFFPYVLPPGERGAFTHFQNRNKEKVGYCLRTRSAVKPVFVSPGHRIDFRRSMEIVLACSKFRLPEPLREAHRLAQRLFAT